MDSGKRTRSWPLLLGARVSRRLAHDSALSNDDYMSIAELFLQLAHKFGLDLVEELETRDRDKDYDCSFPAGSDEDLLCLDELETFEVGF